MPSPNHRPRPAHAGHDAFERRLSRGPPQASTETAGARLDSSGRSIDRAAGDAVFGLSNRIGIPKGKSCRGLSQSSRTYSQSTLSYSSQNNLSHSAGSADSIDWGDGGGSDQFVAPANGRFGRQASQRKRTSSLDNLPEASAVTRFDADAPGRIKQRKSAPDLLGPGDADLYDSVLMDLFSAAAASSDGARSGGGARVGASDENLGSAARRSGGSGRNSLRRSRGDDFDFDFDRVFQAPNSAFACTASNNRIPSARSSDNLDQIFHNRKSSDNSRSAATDKMKNSRSHDNLDQALPQKRRDSVFSASVRLKNSRSQDNLDQTFQFQQPSRQPRPKRRTPGGTEPAPPSGDQRDLLLKLATQLEQARQHNPDDQERIHHLAHQMELARQRAKPERRDSGELSGSGISAGGNSALGDAGLGKSGRGADGSGDPRVAAISTRESVRDAPPSRGAAQSRRSSCAPVVAGRETEPRAQGELHRGQPRRSSVGLSVMLRDRGPPRGSSVAITNDTGASDPLKDRGLSRGVSRRNSLVKPNGLQRNYSRMKIFDDVKAAVGDDDGLEKNANQKNEVKRLDQSDRQMPNEAKPIAECNKQKPKLYDELLSSSDPRIGRSIVCTPQEGGTASTVRTEGLLGLDKSLRSSARCGSDALPKENRRSRRCRKKDKTFLLGTVFMLLGLIGGYLLFLFGPFQKKEDGSAEASGDAEVAGADAEKPTIVLETVPDSSPNETNGTAVEPPPSDIEGMCSVSNLPGALSVCLAACLPSACCYPGFSGESCIDENDPESVEACASYRPFCDVFYDVWLDGTEGVLRSVTDEMIGMCTGAEGNSSNEELPVPGSSSTVKRLRGHTITSEIRSEDILRRLLSGSTQETCQQYCTAAKCCVAAVVTDAESLGLTLSPTRVYTNTSTGEYIMTNCQESNSKNIELCAQYETFCLNGEVLGNGAQLSSSSSNDTVSANPVESPSNTTSTSPGDNLTVDTGNSTGGSVPSISKPAGLTIVASKQPTLAPASAINQAIGSDNSSLIPSAPPNTTAEYAYSPSQSSKQPSFIQSPSMAPGTIPSSASKPPVVSAWNIHKACASDEATLLIASGDASARTKCIDACQGGLCCFTSELGYDWLEPCHEGNEQFCAEYSPCLVLQVDAADSPNEIVAPGLNFTVSIANDTSTPTFNYTVDVGSSSSSSSNETSTDNTSITEMVDNDTTVNKLDNPPANSPNTGNTSDVSTTDNAVTNVPNDVQADGPPVPNQDLSVICSADSISKPAGLETCMNVCELGRCCAIDDESTCYSTHKETCNLYIPCNSAYDLLYS